MDDARSIDAKRILRLLDKPRNPRAKLASNEALRYRYESQKLSHVPFGLFITLLTSLNAGQLEKIAQKPESLSILSEKEYDLNLFYTHLTRITDNALEEVKEEKEEGSPKLNVHPLHRVALAHLGMYIFPLIGGDPSLTF